MNRTTIFHRLLPWLVLSFIAAIGLALLVYAYLGDSYLATSITTAPEREAKSFDLASLSGLASLGSGGQRTTFEEFAFLVGSDTNVRTVLTTRRYARSVAEFSRSGGLEQALLNIEQSARSLLGKSPKLTDPLDRLVGITQKQIDVKKTPEGYFAITLKGAQPEGKVALLRALIERADETVRQRAIANYRGRIATYQHLIDIEQRPAERAILVALVTREYTTYASAQSGQVFAFDYIDAPMRATKVYAPSFITVLFGMIALWAVVCIAYGVVKTSLLRP